MVGIVSGFGKTGLQEWVIQRVTGITLAIYINFMMLFFFNNKNLTFFAWKSLFANWGIKVATLVAFTAVVAHAWIGVWIVITDYIKVFYFRLFLQIFINFILVMYIICCIEILWRV